MAPKQSSSESDTLAFQGTSRATPSPLFVHIITINNHQCSSRWLSRGNVRISQNIRSPQDLPDVSKNMMASHKPHRPCVQGKHPFVQNGFIRPLTRPTYTSFPLVNIITTHHIPATAIALAFPLPYKPPSAHLPLMAYHAPKSYIQHRRTSSELSAQLQQSQLHQIDYCTYLPTRDISPEQPIPSTI